MCAIFSANNLQDFVELYKKNLERGDFAFGGLFFEDEGFCIVKKPGIMNFDDYTIESKTVTGESNIHDLNTFTYFVGHTQAPTSSKQVFDLATSHPFVYRPWIVAHNGVLTNFEALNQEVVKGEYNEVDSSIIPALLVKYSLQIPNDRDVILHVLKMLKGTYSLWIFNTLTKELYFARCGSTLYADLVNNIISSVKANPTMTDIPDGSLFLKTTEGLTQVGMFESNSPFFIP